MKTLFLSTKNILFMFFVHCITELYERDINYSIKTQIVFETFLSVGGMVRLWLGLQHFVRMEILTVTQLPGQAKETNTLQTSSNPLLVLKNL